MSKVQQEEETFLLDPEWLELAEALADEAAWTETCCTCGVD